MTAGGDSACRDKDSFHLAVAQSPAGLNGSSARLDWLEHQLNAYAADKFDMLVLPELFACGYNIGGEVVAVAEPANGPIAMQICKILFRFGNMLFFFRHAFPTATGHLIQLTSCKKFLHTV